MHQIEAFFNYSGERSGIADTGVGIAPADLERIFEPFVSLTPVGSNGARGTGLGLTITRLMTEIMGGDIRVVSEPGKGSTFTVRLMLSSIDTASEVMLPARQVVAYRGQRHCLAVVDDDPHHRELMHQWLEQLGFGSRIYGSAEECLNDPGAMRVDGYLLDISLPGINGWQLVEALRLQRPSGIPIFMLSAHADEWRHAQAHQVEPQDILTKPIRFDRLLKRLQSRLAIDWVTREVVPAPVAASGFDAEHLPARASLMELGELARIGHVRAMHEQLDAMAEVYVHAAPFITHVRALLDGYAMKEVNRLLMELNHDERH